MKRKFRLRKSTEFQRVRRYGSSFAHPLIVLLALPNEQEFSRFGIAAGRSLGNAVHRNRAKRLMRAALQPLFRHVAPGWDVLLIARKPLLGASFPQIQSALSELSTRAKILTNAR
ncbi:MAG: ribonuclease P protein component [Chloroflexi bacterium RBG_16_54_18]|nr:MAG: ribonuclease P protein component [Chloroflexi bacterium RBG_16_54_18]